MSRLEEIAEKFGKPFEEVVCDYATQGYSKTAAAKEIGLAHRYFRDLCKRYDLDQYFPKNMVEMRKECRGGGTGWPSGKPRGKTHNKLGEQVLLEEIKKYPAFSLFRAEAKHDITTVLRRFGSFENGVKAATTPRSKKGPRWEDFYKYGRQLMQEIPGARTFDDIAEELGESRQRIHMECAVSLGKLAYELKLCFPDSVDLTGAPQMLQVSSSKRSVGPRQTLSALNGSHLERVDSTDSRHPVRCDRPGCNSLMKREIIAIGDECYICPVCGSYKAVSRQYLPQTEALLSPVKNSEFPNGEIKTKTEISKATPSTVDAMSAKKETCNSNTKEETTSGTVVTKTKTPRGTCKLCNRPDVIIPGGGKCSRCYSRIKKGLDPLTGELAVVVPSAPQTARFPDEDNEIDVVVEQKAPTLASLRKESAGKHIFAGSEVILSFGSPRDAKLYDLLVHQADKNRRTVESEILFLLEESLAHSATKSWPLEKKLLNDAVPGQVTASLPESTETPVLAVCQQEGSYEHPLCAYLNERSGNFASSKEKGALWLQQTGFRLMKALMSRGITFRVCEGQSPVLTPNAGIFRVQGGPRTTVSAIEARVPEIFTTDGLQIIAVEPEAGSLRIAIARPERELLHTETVLRDYLAENYEGLGCDKVVVGIREEDGKPLVLDPYQQPHTLIAGTTGSGKSVLMQNFILSIAATHSPSESQIFLIDPKFGIDYAPFEKLPHMADGIITSQEAALGLLESAVKEMEKRYRLFRKTGGGVNNVQAYRKATDKPLPTWWIIHDEFADWMQTKEYRKEVPQLVKRLGVNARAAGIFLVFAGQRPDHTVFPNLLRDQLGNRLILKVQSAGTSNVALGEKGAEKLLGKGHMLAKIGGQEAVFAQVPYIDTQDIPQMVDEICRYHRGNASRRLRVVS